MFNVYTKIKRKVNTLRNNSKTLGQMIILFISIKKKSLLAKFIKMLNKINKRV